MTLPRLRRSFLVNGWSLFVGGAVCLAAAGCASNGDTVEPELVPASGLIQTDERDPFRVVRDEAAEERVRIVEASRCEFRVQSVANGAAVDFKSATLSQRELRQQVSRVARAFNAFRSRARQASLAQVGVDAYDWKRLLELAPEASVVDTRGGVRLVLEDTDGDNVQELRARVRWHAAGLLPDPALQSEQQSSAATTCVVVPRMLQDHPDSI